MDPYELMNIGLEYMLKSSNLLTTLPRNYWPSPDMLDERRSDLLRARVLLDIGEEICRIATEEIVRNLGGAANENARAA